MILVKASAGLVIEFGVGESGRWDALSVRLAEGVSAQPFRFEVSAGAGGRLRVRPLEAREAAELVVALGVVLAHEEKILAEVNKYDRAGR
jgi:hypothetical protein